MGEVGEIAADGVVVGVGVFVVVVVWFVCAGAKPAVSPPDGERFVVVDVVVVVAIVNIVVVVVVVIVFVVIVVIVVCIVVYVVVVVVVIVVIVKKLVWFGC